MVSKQYSMIGSHGGDSSPQAGKFWDFGLFELCLLLLDLMITRDVVTLRKANTTMHDNE